MAKENIFKNRTTQIILLIILIIVIIGFATNWKFGFEKFCGGGYLGWPYGRYPYYQRGGRVPSGGGIGESPAPRPIISRPTITQTYQPTTGQSDCINGIVYVNGVATNRACVPASATAKPPVGGCKGGQWVGVGCWRGFEYINPCWYECVPL